MYYELMIGLRYLRAKRKQTFVSVISVISAAGVMVGVAALIIVMSGMVGVQEYMRDKIMGFTAHITVHTLSQEGITNPDEVVKLVKTVPHVLGATPFVEGQMMLTNDDNMIGVFARGIDPTTANSVMALDGASTIKSGAIDELNPDYKNPNTLGDDLPVVALGKQLASDLGVGYGDYVTAIVPKGVLTPMGYRPQVSRFRVGCVYKFGFYDIDSKFVLMHLVTAQKLFKSEGQVNGVDIKTDNIFAVDKYDQAIKQKLAGRYYTTTWIQRYNQLFAALKIEELLSGLVLSLIMLVAAFQIVSMLLMLVMEKYSDIAILKTMGASDGGIMRIFITQGTLIGLFGAVLGLALGLFVCWLQIEFELLKFNEEVYQFSVVPIKLTLANVLGVPIGAILISFLTTLYPSWQAARMRPAESLRYE